MLEIKEYDGYEPKKHVIKNTQTEKKTARSTKTAVKSNKGSKK